MTSYLIECRNKTEVDSSPGDWSTTIQDKIFLEDGDTIVMNKAFIDTNQTATTQLVVGPEGETLTLEHVHYQFNNDLAHGYRCGEGSTWVYKNGEPPFDHNAVAIPVPSLSQPGLLGDWSLGNQGAIDAWGFLAEKNYPTDFPNRTKTEPMAYNETTYGAYGCGQIYSDGNMYIDCDMGETKDEGDIGTMKPFTLLLANPNISSSGGLLVIQYPSIVESPPGSGQYPAVLFNYPIKPMSGYETVTVPAHFNYHIFSDWETNPGNYIFIYMKDTATRQEYQLMKNRTISGVTTYSEPLSALNLSLFNNYNHPIKPYTPTQLNFPYGSLWSTLGKAGVHVYEPHIYKTEIFIPAGNYDPTYMAQLITDKLAGLGPDPTLTNLTKNNLLTTLLPTTKQTWVNMVSTKDHWNDFTRTPSSNALDFRYRYAGVGIADPTSAEYTDDGAAASFVNWHKGVLGYWNMGNLSNNGGDSTRIKPDDYANVFSAGPNMVDGTMSGTNQVSLKFNTETNNFYWEYLHMPYYDSGNEVAGFGMVYNCPEWGSSTRGIIDGDQGYPSPQVDDGGNLLPWVSTGSMVRTNTSLKKIGATGGVMFSGLSSRKGPIDGDGEQTDFWTKNMGFETDTTKATCTLVSWHNEFNKPTGGNEQPPFTVIGDRPMIQKAVFDTNASMPDGVPVAGRHFTEGFLGLSSATIVKNEPTFDKLGWFVGGSFPAAPDTPWSKGVGTDPSTSMPQVLAKSLTETSGKTIVINAHEGIVAQTSKLAFGYYLVEVQSNFENNFITPESNRKNVMAVCSRYYERATYTSATEADSIIYTHRGMPALLSSFRCRILDSDKNTALNLGNDNTVFMQVVKAPKNMEYPPGMNPALQPPPKN